MRTAAIALVAASLLAPLPALAQEAAPDKPITQREPDAADVATTPLNDLNLRKDKIPAVLLAAQARPYDVAGLRRCPAIAAAVVDLDRVLGDDLDIPQNRGNRVNAGKIAQSLVGKLIPFRSVIRELSGANAHERDVDDAIEAGMARRAFLKGLGQAKGCRYPARAATPQVLAARAVSAETAHGQTPDTQTKGVVADKPRSERDEVAAAYAQAEKERKAAEKARRGGQRR